MLPASICWHSSKRQPGMSSAWAKPLASAAANLLVVRLVVDVDLVMCFKVLLKKQRLLRDEMQFVDLRANGMSWFLTRAKMAAGLHNGSRPIAGQLAKALVGETPCPSA